MRMNLNKSLGGGLVGHSYKILGFNEHPNQDKSDYSARLLELGFREGEIVQIINVAPFANDPVVVQIRGSVFALRRAELQILMVEEV